MNSNDTTDLSGIYTAYFNADFGTSLGIFLITSDKIVGADVGGGIYDGNFGVSSGIAKGEVKFELLQGGQTITGQSNGLPIAYEAKFEFSLPLEAAEFHRIETIGGPVNVKFFKIRDL